MYSAASSFFEIYFLCIYGWENINIYSNYFLDTEATEVDVVRKVKKNAILLGRKSEIKMRNKAL